MLDQDVLTRTAKQRWAPGCGRQGGGEELNSPTGRPATRNHDKGDEWQKGRKLSVLTFKNEDYAFLLGFY